MISIRCYHKFEARYAVQALLKKHKETGNGEDMWCKKTAAGSLNTEWVRNTKETLQTETIKRAWELKGFRINIWYPGIPIMIFSTRLKVKVTDFPRYRKQKIKFTGFTVSVCVCVCVFPGLESKVWSRPHTDWTASLSLSSHFIFGPLDVEHINHEHIMWSAQKVVKVWRPYYAVSISLNVITAAVYFFLGTLKPNYSVSMGYMHA